MSDLLKAVKCIVCKSILQSPVILPCCQLNICQKHIPTDSPTIECVSCGEVRTIPSDGFAPNPDKSLLIKLNLSEYQRANESCKSLRTKIDAFRAHKAHFESRLNLIGDLKSQVKSKRDEMIDDLRRRSDCLLVEFDNCESECKSVLQQMEINDKVGEEKNATRLGELQAELRKFDEKDIDGNSMRWKSILENSELEMTRLSSRIEKMSGFEKKINNFKAMKNKFCKLRISEPLDRLLY